ncbi:uncharacterized protein NH340_JMT03312 [Sarcoptes scabiei]|nr:uncharacterized protein NH340_JMT03312 [Sarcoptes scabiei]
MTGPFSLWFSSNRIRIFNAKFRIVSNLSILDRERFRLVSKQWSQSIDHLARAQQNLSLIGHCERDVEFPFDAESTVDSGTLRIRNDDILQWRYPYIRYQCFSLLLKRFPNLQSIRFESISFWNDHLIEELINCCKQLRSLAFVHCNGIGRSRLFEEKFTNLTLIGWNRLVTAYGNQLHTLILRDCDLTDQQLSIVLDGFRNLSHLDIVNNRLKHGDALKNLPRSIKILKIGSIIQQNRSDGNHDVKFMIPFRSICSGNGRGIEELTLYSFVDKEFVLITSMINLKKLILSDLMEIILDNRSQILYQTVAALQRIKCLEIYQHIPIDRPMISDVKHFDTILKNCENLTEFVLNLDPFDFESIINDQFVQQLVNDCPNLSRLQLGPGSALTTNSSFESISSLNKLTQLKLIEFVGTSQAGIINLVSESRSLRRVEFDDCCQIELDSFSRSMLDLHRANPERFLSINFTSHKGNRSKLSGYHLSYPERNPKILINLDGCCRRDFSIEYLRSQTNQTIGKAILNACNLSSFCELFRKLFIRSSLSLFLLLPSSSSSSVFIKLLKSIIASIFIYSILSIITKMIV